MKNLHPYKIFWWATPLIFLSIALGPDSIFDLQLHDTYYVVSSFHFAIVCSLLFGFFGAIYWLFRERKLIHFLSILHAFTSVISFMGLTVTGVYSHHFNDGSLETFTLVQKVYSGFIFLFFGIQIPFVFNIIIGLIRKG